MKNRLLAFLLVFGILLSGCTVAGPAPTTVSTETTQATTENFSGQVRPTFRAP